MKLHNDSHLDHALTAAQLAHILLRFADRDAFFVETFEIPEGLGAAPSGLYGPLMGDLPIPDADVELARRGERTWPSRIVQRPPRMTRLVTVIAGPHDGQPCVLFTAYGGPLAPREPGDPGCPSHEQAASRAFWAEHALAADAKAERSPPAR